MTPIGLAAPPIIRRCGRWATGLARRMTYQEQVAWPAA
jgi:hypothetical protein